MLSQSPYFFNSFVSAWGNCGRFPRSAELWVWLQMHLPFSQHYYCQNPSPRLISSMHCKWLSLYSFVLQFRKARTFFHLSILLLPTSTTHGYRIQIMGFWIPLTHILVRLWKRSGIAFSRHGGFHPGFGLSGFRIYDSYFPIVYLALLSHN